MVGTRSHSAKKTETKSDVVMHYQPKSDNNRDESNEQNSQDSEVQEIGNQNLPLVTENGFSESN